MYITPSQLLQKNVVIAAFKLAWHESIPGVDGGHEEGGFVLQNDSGEICVQRWPIGRRNQISVPPHRNCRVDENEILASFHTHPNTGRKYLQEPSATDRRAVRDDPDLKGDLYVGEFVIADGTIYLIQPDGEVMDMVDRRNLFQENQ